MDIGKFIDMLVNYGQEKFLSQFILLEDDAREQVLNQADLLDFGMLKRARKNGDAPAHGKIEPISTMKLKQVKDNSEHYRELGLEAIRKGEVGAVLLAGGMGTRLGFEGPKGMCDIGVTRPVYIFQRIFENLLEVVKEAGKPVPLFIMTSYLNNLDTRRFLEEQNYFGYDPDYVSFFVQDMSPCLDRDGNMFFENDHTIAMSPNGNGGFYSSMISNGVDLKVMEYGIKYINVFAVDNVLQRAADPVFVGALISSGCTTGAKVVKKASKDERVGAICLEDGSPSVVEYYEMTDELLNAVGENGEPLYQYGVILNYLFRIENIDKVARQILPVHMVKRKVSYFDGKGTVYPEEPNAYKLETLVLDAVHLTDSCLPMEVERTKEFAPIKNSVGIDSVDTARELLRLNGYEL